MDSLPQDANRQEASSAQPSRRGRKPKQERLDWFPHESNLLSDRRMQQVIATHKIAGYGIFCGLSEMAAREPGCKLPLNDMDIRLYAHQLGVKRHVLETIIKTLIEVGLFDAEVFNNERALTNEILQDSLASLLTKRANSRRGRISETENEAKQPFLKQKCNRGEERTGEDITEEGEERTANQPSPSLEKEPEPSPPFTESEIDLLARKDNLDIDRKVLIEQIRKAWKHKWDKGQEVKRSDRLNWLLNWLEEDDQFKSRVNHYRAQHQRESQTAPSSNGLVAIGSVVPKVMRSITA